MQSSNLFQMKFWKRLVPLYTWVLKINYQIYIREFKKQLSNYSILLACHLFVVFVFVLQEILLAFRIRVGSSDTINVKQLLDQDLVELSHHFQVIYLCLLDCTIKFLFAWFVNTWSQMIREFRNLFRNLFWNILRYYYFLLDETNNVSTPKHFIQVCQYFENLNFQRVFFYISRISFIDYFNIL